MDGAYEALVPRPIGQRVEERLVEVLTRSLVERPLICQMLTTHSIATGLMAASLWQVAHPASAVAAT